MSADAEQGAGSPAGPPRTLTEEHLTFLTNAAITPDIAASAGVYSATESADLPSALHVWRSEVPGIVFPWWRAASGPVGDVGPDGVLWQLRPDTPIARRDGKGVAKYVFPPKAINALNTHPLMRHLVHDAGIPIVLIEGTKQYLAGVSALAGSVEPIAAVGLAGCYGWSQGGQPIPDLRAVPWGGRQVFLCFDADVDSNRDVWEAASKLRDWLVASGVATVHLLKLPGGSTTGLDDVLAQMVDPRESMANIIGAAAKTKAWPRRPARKKSGEWFDEDGGLLAEKTANMLLDEHPCALAADKTIATYSEGRYVVDQDAILPFIADMLGERHRPTHLSTVEQVVRGKLMIERKALLERPDSPWLNVKNGMLDLLTGKLHPHSPEYLSTFQLPIEWDPKAKCPTYEAWLPTVLKEGQGPVLEETAATMLDPSHTPHKAIFLFGKSRSGKSTFLRLMKAIMGAEATSAVTLHQLSDNQFAAAELYGKKLNVAADLSSRHVEDISTWKMLTGEDLIEANRKHGRLFRFTNQALFAFSANELPTVGEGSRAYFARIAPFHFPTSFQGHEDQSIEDRMLTELPGILRRWVEAFRTAHERGSKLPIDSETAQMFETQSDRVRLWLSEDMEIMTSMTRDGTRWAVSEGISVPPDVGTAHKILYDEFRSWTEENGYSSLGFRKFSERLTSIDGVCNVRIKPKSTRGLNIRTKKQDAAKDPDMGSMGSFEDIAAMPNSGDNDQEAQIRHGENGVETAQTAHEVEGPGPEAEPVEAIDDETATTATGEALKIEYSVWTASVYAAISADPEKITSKRLIAELDISDADLKAEVDYLEKAGALRSRRPRRGFEVLAPITEHYDPYAPCDDPRWVNSGGEGGDEAPMNELFRGVTYSCVHCGEPDDEGSEYFPQCAECRADSGEW